MAMRFEIEQKFPVANPVDLVQKIAALAASWSGPQDQIDVYFAHPVRDFGVTDEALRIRLSDGKCCLTYKGPKIDEQTKSRREIELGFDHEVTDAGRATELFESLGFRPVMQVDKQRRSARLERHGHSFSIDLDRVHGLGDFVELETISDADGLSAATTALAKLAEELGLRHSIRQSYLELLLEKASGSGTQRR